MQPAALSRRATILLPLLCLLLALLSCTATTAQDNGDAAGTCATGVPADGTIPSDWTVRRFSLTLTQQGSFILVNGTSPGPRLVANQFDWVEVTVTSNLSADAITAMHWHGLSMYETPYADGVSGVTQCGQQTGRTVVYSFCAYPSGDHWYHSLSQLQTIRGLYGAMTVSPLVIRNVSTLLNATVTRSFADDFVWIAADWYNETSTFSDYTALPSPIGVLVDGASTNSTHIYTAGINATTVRLLNAGSTSSFTFSVDGANLNLTAIDGTQVVPYPLSSITLTAGQRATAVLDFTNIANYTSVYYRVARNAGANPDWVGVLHIGANTTDTSYPNYAVSACTTTYSNGTDANCTVMTQSIPQAPINQTLTDVNALQARPINYEGIGSAYYGAGLVDIPIAGYSLDLAILLLQAPGANTAVLPYINNATYNSTQLNDAYASDNIEPILYDALITLYNSGNTSNLTSTPSPVLLQSTSDQYIIPSGGVVDMLLLNNDPVQHSFHMHGHHFWVIAASDAPQAQFLYANRYMVRDTVAIPANGWARIRMVGNNPGVWLFGSANEVYLTQGFALVMVESVDTMTPNYFTVPYTQYALCSQAIQTALTTGVATWHSANDPLTYADTGLTQASRIVIGTVIGGVTGAALIVIILCTVVGIKRDPVKVVKKGGSAQSAGGSPGSSPAGAQQALDPAEQTVTGTPELSARRGLEAV